MALAVLRASGVLGDDVKGQFVDGALALAGVFVDITLRVFALKGFNVLRKHLNLRQKQGMGKQAPTMHKHGRPLHSSSSGSAASRSTFT